jgi:hypothetical protein
MIQNTIPVPSRLELIEHRLGRLENELTSLRKAQEEIPYLTAHIFCWEHSLPDDSTTLIKLIRLAGRYSHESAAAIGYQNNPDFGGEGLTFRRDVLEEAARELELLPPTPNR